MKKLFKLFTVLIIITLTVSCGDDLPVDQNESGIYTNGYFITNEGPFSNGTGTITFVGDEGTVVQNIFKTANNEDLGSIVQSMIVDNDNAYIVVNNSHKIVVVNRHTFEKTAIIEGDYVNNPRYVVVVDNTAYVSNWGNASDATDDFISVINLDTNTLIETIAVGEGPEKMVALDNKIYVNLKGGYSQNDKVVVIDINSNIVTKTIIVGDVPNSIINDGNSIWVLCAGKPSYSGEETNGKLIKIENDEVILTLNFANTTDHPNFLSLNGSDLIYSLNGSIYNYTIDANELNTVSLEGLDGFYYSVNVNESKLYATDAGNYASEGNLKVFNLEDNTLINTITTGVIPGSVVFP